MTSLRLSIAVACGFLIGLSGCDGADPETPAVPSPAPVAAPAPSPLPAVASDDARQFVQEGGELVIADFPSEGATSFEDQVRGDAAPVYAVPVRAGQTLTVAMETPSDNLYFNISEATDHSGGAVHRGEMDGAAATLTPERDMTYVVTPFQPRAAARRGEAGNFTLRISRQ